LKDIGAGMAKEAADLDEQFVSGDICFAKQVFYA
jgi:hypothetical protein